MPLHLVLVVQVRESMNQVAGRPKSGVTVTTVLAKRPEAERHSIIASHCYGLGEATVLQKVVLR